MQKQTEEALEYTGKWRVTADASKCAVDVCNADRESPVDIKRKWGEEGLPIDQYTQLVVEISTNCSWDAYINEVIGKGEAVSPYDKGRGIDSTKNRSHKYVRRSTILVVCL